MARRGLRRREASRARVAREQPLRQLFLKIACVRQTAFSLVSQVFYSTTISSSKMDLISKAAQRPCEVM